MLSSAAVNGYLPGRNQVAGETAAILRGDIPYYTVRMDGHDLCDSDGRFDQNCISQSPREHFTRCLNLLSERDLEFHCRLFRLACAKVLLPRALPAPQIRPTRILTDAECVRRAEDIAAQLLEELLPGPRGGLCCFTMLPGREDATEIAPYDLAHGRCGIGIFLSAMLKNGTNAELKGKLTAVLDEIVSGMRDEAEALLEGRAAVRNEANQFTNGIAGYLFAADLISRYSGNEACRELYEALRQRIGDRAVRNEKKNDCEAGETLLPTDSLDGGSCAVIDSLLETGRAFGREELIRSSRALLTEMVLRADACGGYQLVPLRFAPVRIPGLYFGLAGVGYTLLRQADAELASVTRQ